MYVTNATARPNIPGRDRPVSGKRRYCFGRFAAFFFVFWTWGWGGVASILRSTSSALGWDGSRRGFLSVITNRFRPGIFCLMQSHCTLSREEARQRRGRNRVLLEDRN